MPHRTEAEGKSSEPHGGMCLVCTLRPERIGLPHQRKGRNQEIKVPDIVHADLKRYLKKSALYALAAKHRVIKSSKETSAEGGRVIGGCCRSWKISRTGTGRESRVGTRLLCINWHGMLPKVAMRCFPDGRLIMISKVSRPETSEHLPPSLPAHFHVHAIANQRREKSFSSNQHELGLVAI